MLYIPLKGQHTNKTFVVDAVTGKALPFASIMSDSQVAMANAEGVFAIEAQDGQTITISAIGYNALEIRAEQISDTTRLQKLKVKTGEENSSTAQDILRKLVKKMAKEYKFHAKTRSAYFVRQTSSLGQWMETCESFQVSESALNIGNTKRAGEIIYRVDHHGYNTRLPYADLQHLTELGATTVESRYWQYTEKPLRLKFQHPISTYDPFPTPGTLNSGVYRTHADIDIYNFTYSLEMLQDTTGRDIAKVYVRVHPDFWNSQEIKDILMNKDDAWLTDDKKSQHVRIKDKEKLLKWVEEYDKRRRAFLQVRNTYGTTVRLRDAMEPDAFPIIDGVIWVDVKNNQLLAFQGTLHNFSLSPVYFGEKKKFMAEVFVDITYSHQNKFTEVENLALWVKADSLTSQTQLCNLRLDSKTERRRITKKSRKPVEAEQLTDMPRPILRTALEERIVAEAKEEKKEQ